MTSHYVKPAPDEGQRAVALRAEGLTLDEIGRLRGVGRERVRQLIAQELARQEREERMGPLAHLSIRTLNCLANHHAKDNYEMPANAALSASYWEQLAVRLPPMQEVTTALAEELLLARNFGRKSWLELLLLIRRHGNDSEAQLAAAQVMEYVAKLMRMRMIE